MQGDRCRETRAVDDLSSTVVISVKVLLLSSNTEQLYLHSIASHLPQNLVGSSKSS